MTIKELQRREDECLFAVQSGLSAEKAVRRAKLGNKRENPSFLIRVFWERRFPRHYGIYYRGWPCSVSGEEQLRKAPHLQNYMERFWRSSYRKEQFKEPVKRNLLSLCNLIDTTLS